MNRALRGFTLVKILVALTVIAVLLFLSFSALRSIHARSMHARSLQNLRSHAQAISAYTNDHRSFFPHFTRVGAFNSDVSGGGISVSGLSYFDVHKSWHIALADGYYQGDARSEVFAPPGFIREDGHRWPFETRYHVPCAFIADPAYWNERTRLGPEQYRGTKMSDVAFSAAKTIVVQAWYSSRETGAAGWEGYRPITAAFCDGSARRVEWERRLSGYQNGDGYEFANSGAVHYSDSPPLLHAQDGVRGRDVR